MFRWTALFGALLSCAATQAAAQAQTRPIDPVFVRAQALVSDGNGAAGRALIDSVIKVTPPMARLYPEALFWRASLASNAAASLGMMPHPVTGESGVDLNTAKHWIDVLGMLEEKTQGNLEEQEAQVLETLLADLRMQYVSFTSAPTPPPAKFSASDITGGK